MAKIIVAMIGGVVLGTLVTLAATQFESSSNTTPEDFVRDINVVPKMAQAVADKHRKEQYIHLTSVEAIIALPTAFARSEALYAIAGRSDAAEVQNLIFEGNRIADEVERIELHKILFFRLTELDPDSALALARVDDFKGIKPIEQVVWHTWARNDLDGALIAAKNQVSLVHQNSAAQSLYAAFGYMGNETTDRIEAVLGIGPSRASRGLFLYQLADRSPAVAIAFINGLERGIEQQEYVSWLAFYVSLSDAKAALAYAKLFAVALDATNYTTIINRLVASDNPRVTIERSLASGGISREYLTAVKALASTDPDAAMQYFEQASSTQQRQRLGWVIAAELAKKNQVGALKWARENDNEQNADLEMSALLQIAVADPQLALTEALNSPNKQQRSELVEMVVDQIAQADPARAAAFLDQIENEKQKFGASRKIVSSWIHKDSEAAVDWILGQDKQLAEKLIQQAGATLLRRDIDAAIRLLPRADKRSQEKMRKSIALKLATNRSLGEAQSFIQQFEGQPDYDQLQVAVILGLAQTDAPMAKQFADQLPDGKARDDAYVSVIVQQARSDPIEATRWLNNVSDEYMRGTAAGRLATHWYTREPEAAQQWATNLPVGLMRDHVIMLMASEWDDPTAEQINLIGSIEDPDKRGQAKSQKIIKLMRTDPAAARKLLKDADIPSFQRQQLETLINRFTSKSY